MICSTAFTDLSKYCVRLSRHFVRKMSTTNSETQYLTLPNGSKLPAVGLGTWQAQDEELEKALECALLEGYRHIDTAILYENENVIGRVLKKWMNENKVARNEFFLTTKLPPMGNYPEKVEGYLKASLNNLQVDYVDLYLIHCPDGIKDISAITQEQRTVGFEMDRRIDHVLLWKEMEKQVKMGRTKAIGLSNFSKSQIEIILGSAEIKPANLQIEVHAFLQQKELVDFCQKNGISVVAYSPLGSPGINNFYSEYGKRVNVPDLLGNPVVQRIAVKHKKTPAQVLLRFNVQRGIGVIPKSTNPCRIRENINIFDFVLDNEDFKDLQNLEIGPSAKVGNWESWTWV